MKAAIAAGKRPGLVIVALLLLVTPAQSAQELQTSTVDGLELVRRPSKSDGVAVVYVRPGATLARYKRVILDPVEVAFDRSWMPRPPVKAQDRERIRRELAAEFRATFADELANKGGYEVVEAAEPDVLRVTASIVDLYIQQPGVGTSQWDTYVVSASRMSLIGELRDAESGAILARVADRRAAASPGRIPGSVQWTTKKTNRAEARRVLRIWAELLREALDSAREAAP